MSFLNKSETLSWVPSGKKALPLDFLDRVGPRTGRAAIEQIIFKCVLNITTPAANTIVGADMAGFIKRLRIADALGNRFYLTGAKARVCAHLDMGDCVPVDPATHAASTTQNDTFYLVVNFAQIRSARRMYDYALPVDDLQNGGTIEIEMPAATDIFQSGTLAVINSGTYTAYIKYREEWDVEFHARDVREETTTLNNAFYYSVGNGRLLRSLTAYKEAITGGTSVTTVSDVTIDTYKMVVTERDILKQLFLARGVPVLASQDPYFNDKALPIIFPAKDAKYSDSLLIPGQLGIRLTSTLTTPDLIAHYVAPKDERMMRATAETNGIDASQLRVKTAAKTAQDPRAWGNLAAFASVKSPRAA